MFGRRDAHARGRGRLAAVATVAVVVVVVAAVLVTRLPARTTHRRSGAPRARALHALPTLAFERVAQPVDAVLAHSPFPPPTTAAPRAQSMVRPGVGTRPLRILVVGDSVGVSFAQGLQQWAALHGGAQVLDDARFWCPLGRRLPIIQGMITHADGSGCDWTQRWAEAVRDFNPDVTIVLFSIWEVSPRQLPGHTDFLAPGAPALDAWQLSEYRAAADELSARGAPVVWFTIPCEQALNRPGQPLWIVDHRTIPALAASRPAVHVVDLDRAICGHGPMSAFGGVAVPRPDGAHFSEAGALAASDWVMPIVLGQVPNPA